MSDATKAILRQVSRYALWVLAVFAVSGIATAVFINVIYPKLSDIPGFTVLFPRFPIIINRTEQVRIAEGIDIRGTYERIRPAVVSVLSHQGGLAPGAADFSPPTVSSGMIATDDGLILVSRRATGDAPRIDVVLTDGTIYRATLVASDVKSDLAVLKIDAANLPIVQFEDAASLQVGDRVIAVGASFSQFQNPVRAAQITFPLASLQDYGERWSADELHEFVSVDATFDQKFFGAPLVNRDARVVGLIGPGGILPGQEVLQSLNHYLSAKTIAHGTWGLRYTPVTPAIAQASGLAKPYGALLLSGVGQPAVIAGSAAATAGLREGDFVYKINSIDLDAVHSFEQVSNQFFAGDKVTLEVWRANAQLTLSLIPK